MLRITDGMVAAPADLPAGPLHSLVWVLIDLMPVAGTDRPSRHVASFRGSQMDRGP